MVLGDVGWLIWDEGCGMVDMGDVGWWIWDEECGMVDME